MRVALSRPCPGGPFSRFQAAPLRTPAAICQDCGLLPTASPSPRGCYLCPYLDCKGTAIFINCKKNLKKYLISLIIKHLKRGIFAVKRFNRPCPGIAVALPVLRWWLPMHARTHARAYACMQAQARQEFIKTFCFSLSASGRYLCSPEDPGHKNKTF